jgi:hypothetical protein
MISKIQFRIFVTTNWTDFTDYVSDYTYLTGTNMDPSVVQSNIIKVIPKFGYSIRQVYGPTAENAITSDYNGLVAGLFEAVALIENNVETTNLTTRVATNVIDRFSKTMNSLNSDWPIDTLTTLYVDTWTSWLEQAVAKKNNDEIAFSAAETKAINLTNEFIDVYVNGVIKQYQPIFF